MSFKRGSRGSGSSGRAWCSSSAREVAAHAGHAGARSGGGHYRLTIVARAFDGKPVQQRHRMVYDALGPMMRHEIHALAIRAYAPGEI